MHIDSMIATVQLNGGGTGTMSFTYTYRFTAPMGTLTSKMKEASASAMCLQAAKSALRDRWSARATLVVRPPGQYMPNTT